MVIPDDPATDAHTWTPLTPAIMQMIYSAPEYKSFKKVSTLLSCYGDQM